MLRLLDGHGLKTMGERQLEIVPFRNTMVSQAGGLCGTAECEAFVIWSRVIV